MARKRAGDDRNATREDKGHRCQQCGKPVSVIWHLPTSCKECGAAFDQRPRWFSTLTFFMATIVAVVIVALVRPAIEVTGALIAIGLCVGFVAYNLIELLCFHAGVLKLTNLNVPDDTAGPRLATYAGTDKRTRAQQAQQLRESIEFAKSLRSDGTASDVGAHAAPKRPASDAAHVVDAPITPETRCRFRRIDADDERGVRAMSVLATRIVREHFDPIVGVEQNDYMIARFQTPEAIAAQIDEGYEYYFVLPPKAVSGQSGEAKPGRVRPIGFVALQARDAGELYLSKFYLVKEERGKGYARSMMGLVEWRGRELGCDYVRLNVNRNNYQAILAYEHLGFQKTGERKTDIGGGYVMDDFIYERDL